MVIIPSVTLKVLSYQGRLLSIAFIKGARAEINAAPLLMKNLIWQSSTLRSKDEESIYDLAQSVRENSVAITGKATQ